MTCECGTEPQTMQNQLKCPALEQAYMPCQRSCKIQHYGQKLSLAFAETLDLESVDTLIRRRRRTHDCVTLQNVAYGIFYHYYE